MNCNNIDIQNICKNIDKKFKKLNCDYGSNLYNSVKKNTNNFSTNLNFEDLKNKISDDHLDYIVQNYCYSNKNIFLLIVWPVTYNPDQILYNTYNKYGKILYKKEIFLENEGFKNILHFISDKKKHPWGEKLWFAEPHRYKNPLTIYVFEANNITEISDDIKRNYLIEIFNNNKKHINNIEKRGGLNNLYVTTKAKRECRSLFIENGNVAKVKGVRNLQYSHHVNDEHYETIELSRIFFNKNTLNLIQSFKFNELEKFEKKFNSFFDFLIKNNICLNDILIYNSSVLAPFGLREPSDIDFLQGGNKLISQKDLPEDIDIQNKWFKRGYMILETENKSQYMEDNPRFMRNESINSNIFIWKLSLDDIIYNPTYYFYYKNIKFMTPQLFEKVKKIRNRPKDLEQLTYLNYINTKQPLFLNDLPQNIVDKYCKSKNIKIINTNNESISDDKILFETTGNKYSHYRIIYKNNDLVYKLIDFSNTTLDIFLSQTKYDKFFHMAIEKNFYSTVALVDKFIYDKKNKIYIGYCGVKLNEIKIFDKNKLNDLIERLVLQYKKTGLIFTDLTTRKRYKSNVMEYNNKYYIIDLECMCDKTTYLKYKNIRFKHNNKYYEEKLDLQSSQ